MENINEIPGIGASEAYVGTAGHSSMVPVFHLNRSDHVLRPVGLHMHCSWSWTTVLIRPRSS